MEGMWQNVETRVRDRLGQVGFETWIAPLNFIGVEGKTATIQAPNKFFRDWVNDRYLELLRQCLSDEAGMSIEVALIVEHQNGRHIPAPPRPPVIPPQASPQNATMNNREARTQLLPRYTFAEFVVGSGEAGLGDARIQHLLDEDGGIADLAGERAGEVEGQEHARHRRCQDGRKVGVEGEQDGGGKEDGEDSGRRFAADGAEHCRRPNRSTGAGGQCETRI